jgi:hypothetical protein
MKKIRLRIIFCFSLLLLAAMIIPAAACSSSSTTPTSSGPVTLSSVTIDPAQPDPVAIGSSQQFKAMAKYSDGTTKDVSSQTTWASSDKTVATVDSTGLATGVAGGNTAITAQVSGATGTILFGVIGVAAPAGGMPGGPPGGAPGGAPPGGAPGGAPPGGAPGGAPPGGAPGGAPSVITFDQAAANVGKLVSVTAAVNSVLATPITAIFLGGGMGVGLSINVQIPGYDVNSVSGKTITVVGTVDINSMTNSPEIIVTNASQITVH